MRLLRSIAALAFVLLSISTLATPAAGCFPGSELLVSMRGFIVIAEEVEDDSSSREPITVHSVTEYRTVMNGSRGARGTALAVAVRSWGPANGPSVKTLKNRKGPSGSNGCWTPESAPLVGETSYLVSYGGSANYWVHGDVQLSQNEDTLGPVDPGEVTPAELRARLDSALGPAQDRGPSLHWLLIKGVWILFDPLFGISVAVLAILIYRRRRNRARDRALVRGMIKSRTRTPDARYVPGL